MIRNTIRNTIQNTIRNTLGDDAFNMLDLFSGGQRGVWYDPSDLATMFQESTGGTAVTEDGQPVGLMYDKSRGEIFGDELVTNIDGSNGTVGWYSPRDASTLSVVNNKITSTANISDTFGVAQQIDNLDVTKDYIFTMDVSTSAATTIYLRVSTNVIIDGGFISSVTGAKYTHKIIAEFKPLNSTVYLGSIIAGSTAGTVVTIDNVSFKEVLGTTATQPVATKRPTYKDTPDRLEIDLVDDALLFDVPTGGIDGYMVVGTNDGTASYGVSLPAGSYELGGDYFPSNTINGFLLREGAVSKSDLAKVEKDFVSKGAKASYGDVTDFSRFWREKNITEFPLIDTGSGTNFQSAWRNNNLTSFPLIDTSSGANFQYAWYGNNLTSFPLIDTSSGTNFSYAWFNNNLTSFPLLNTSNGTNFQSAWQNNNLASFPLIDTGSGTNFYAAWRYNNLTSFSKLNFANATTFYYAWANNPDLVLFPANVFDNCPCIDFTGAFLATALTQSSIDGILVSINSNGTSNGTFTQSGGSAPSAAGQSAIDAMRSRGWTITVTGGY